MVSLLVTKITTGKPNVLGYRLMFDATESMEPEIHAKSLILCKAVNADEIKVGDIVGYRLPIGKNMPSLTIVHRVIKIEHDGSVIVKGDNNKEADKPVSPEQIAYKVVWH